MSFVRKNCFFGLWLVRSRFDLHVDYRFFSFFIHFLIKFHCLFLLRHFFFSETVCLQNFFCFRCIFYALLSGLKLLELITLLRVRISCFLFKIVLQRLSIDYIDRLKFVKLFCFLSNVAQCLIFLLLLLF